MRWVKPPLGSRIQCDTHSCDQADDVAGSMFCLSGRFRLCQAPSQPSQPPHARAARRNVTSRKRSLRAEPASVRHPPEATALHLDPQLRCEQPQLGDPSDGWHPHNPPLRDKCDAAELSRICQVLLWTTCPNSRLIPFRADLWARPKGRQWPRAGKDPTHARRQHERLKCRKHHILSTLNSNVDAINIWK